MTTSSQAIMFLLKIQAEHATKSYQRQLVEQMYSYYDEKSQFSLLALM
jgi:hypothetical protein